jgi:hypothetical protein
MLLNTLTSQNPNHLWGFWSAAWQNPKHLAFSGSNVTAAKELKAEEDQASREYFLIRETLENPAHLRENRPVIAGMDWVDGKQAAWLR